MNINKTFKPEWANYHFAHRWKMKPRLLLLDTLAIFSALFLAILVNHVDETSFQPEVGFYIFVVMVLAINLSVLAIAGTYRTMLDRIDFEDMAQIFKAVSISSLLVGAIFIVVSRGNAGLLFVVTDYLFTLVFVGGLRTSKRVYLQILRRNKSALVRPVLIAGAGSAGELTLQAIFQKENNECVPVGMIDDDKGKQGMTIHGVPVVGTRKDIPRLVRELKVQELLVAMPSALPSVIKEITQLGRQAGVKRIRILPALHRLVSGNVAASDLRDIQVEDLLGREPVEISTNEIGEYLKNKIVLVTGGAGSIGSELCRQIATFHPAILVVLDQDETGLFYLKQELSLRFSQLRLSVMVCDIQDTCRVESIFARFKPNVVFHAAAYKHVGMMEENPEEAIRNNVFGTKAVGEAACAYGTEKFVLISTDKAVNPTCIMGATKRLAESVVKNLNERGNCRFMSVRFGNVLGSRGSVVPIFREQIQRGGPVTVTHPEMRRYFMTPFEAALLVLQAGAIGSGGEVFVLDMGEPVLILNLAREMIQLAGLEPDKDIPIVFTNPHPGEKLFEDILTAEEGTSATKHRRINVAKTSKATVTEANLREGLKELQYLVSRGDLRATVATLGELVPEYSPSSDIFLNSANMQGLAPSRNEVILTKSQRDG